MPMRLRTELPDFAGAAAWTNGGTSKAALAGRPALVHFWSHGCSCCKDHLPVVNAWREAYGGDRGLQVVGVHSPRSEAEADAAAAQAAIERYALRHPVVLDHERAAAEAFGNEIVPSYYLFDEAGLLRHYQAGERGLGMLEQRIRSLLKPKKPDREGL